MTRHTITEEDLNEWLKTPQWQTFASSFSKGSNKVLDLDAAADGVVFRVTDHGNTLFIGTDKSLAIKFYNEAP